MELEAGSGDDPLRGSLVVLNLKQDQEERRQYEAISYVWGCSDTAESIETPGSYIPLTSSLFSALSRFRRDDQPHILWADAICINQANNSEKSRQVQMMNVIYSRAEALLVYLGEHDDDTHDATWMIDHIVDQMQKKECDKKDLYYIENAHPDEWRKIQGILNRPWFERVWTIQEFVAASEVYFICGDWTIDFNLLRPIFKIIVEAADHYSTLTYLIGVRDSFQKGEGISLSHILSAFQGYKSTRSRDKLFALRSIASDTKDSTFDPDYSEPLESVVKRYAAGLVERGDTMKLLYDAGLRVQSSLFPSWIPDWMVPSKYSAFDPLNFLKFSASAEREARVSYVSEVDILIVLGGLVDEVAEVSQDWEGISEPQSIVGLENEMIEIPKWKAFLSNIDPITKSISAYPTGEELCEVLWKMLIGNWIKYDDEDPNPLRDRYQAFKVMVGIKQPISLQDTFEATKTRCGSLYDILSGDDIGLANSDSTLKDISSDNIGLADSDSTSEDISSDDISHADSDSAPEDISEYEQRIVKYMGLIVENFISYFVTRGYIEAISNATELTADMVEYTFPDPLLSRLSAPRHSRLTEFAKTYISEIANRIEQAERNKSNAANPKAVDNYRLAFRHCIAGRKFCRTTRGYVGLVPNNTRPRDVISILYGAETPFVLRRSEAEDDGQNGDKDGSKPFHLVGPCYIHGIMNSEALAREDFEETEIVLL